MARHEFRALDRIRVSVHGENAYRMFAPAAAQGIRLRQISSNPEGYSATLLGRDWPRLENLAGKYGLTLSITEKQGPGHTAARLWQRPGIVLGLALFFILVHFLSGFVWGIDFGSLTADQAETVRFLLDKTGLREGTKVTQELLRQASQALESQPEFFGWVGINFSGGCLFVESTPMQQQKIRQVTEQTALYASADAEIVLIEVESGFSQVQPGQLVAKGQLLAAAERFDRDGVPVTQSASGSVIGRVRGQYSAQQLYEVPTSVLTRQVCDFQTLYLLGFEIPLSASGQEDASDTETTTRWVPLELGRIALPGCLRIVEQRTRETVNLHYSNETAQALARRQCTMQLLQQYPDARIELQSFQYTDGENGVICRAEYVFCADIAQAGQAQPLDPPQA